MNQPNQPQNNQQNQQETKQSEQRSEGLDTLIGELHEREKHLILAIRAKYRYAEMRIITRDGLPFRLKIVERFEDLSDTL